MADRRRRAPSKRRRAPKSQEDDRPRGYEPTRMRRLWQDIDQSRDKLGLGSATPKNGAGLPWEQWLSWATGVVGDAGARVSALPGQVGSVLGQLPGAGTCQTVGESALTIARRLPVVGTILSLVPDESDEPMDDDAKG